MEPWNIRYSGDYMALDVTDATFATEVLENELPVLVDFWAPSCGPCLALAPFLSALGEKAKEHVKVVKLNVDDNPETAALYNVRGLPTVIVFEGGEESKRLVGAQHPTKYLEALGLEVY